ncbi:hypothetical protein EMIT0324P_50141 [Pseudomonas chlororaphis]
MYRPRQQSTDHKKASGDFVRVGKSRASYQQRKAMAAIVGDVLPEWRLGHTAPTFWGDLCTAR